MGFVLVTPPGDVAFSIALGVLLLTVVLEPIVRACVHRIRAARAWKSIENHEAVDITKYNIFSEAMGDRGRWDTARVVTIMLAAFHVSVWGLELSLDLAIRTDGPVDLMNRPPPVVSSGNPDAVGSGFDWIVQENVNAVNEKGTLGNFKNGTRNGFATSVYRIGDDLVKGGRVFASWSTAPGNAPSELFYDAGGEAGTAYAVVEGVVCSTSSSEHVVFLANGADGQQTVEWGSAVECEVGPKLLNASANESPPTIILSSGSDTHVIVEEESSYPSFLYSVWRPLSSGDGSNASEPTEMHHVFYVSSTTRLAEAIVSGVVNGIMSGGGCVDLLSQFSLANTAYSTMSRVTPFGEYPNFSSVESIDQVEAIVEGVKVSDIGTTCGLILMVVTGVSFVGCLGSTRSRRSMDVFDRDAVIRAVALPNGVQEVDITSPALKIYVRRSDERFGMVVSDDAARRRWIHNCIKRLSPGGLAGSSSSAGGGDDDDDDDDAPPARGISRSWSLPRASFSRSSGSRSELAGARNPGENRGEGPAPPVRTPIRTPVRTPVRSPAQSPTYVELVASPIPSPIHSLVRRGSVLRGLPTFFSSSMTSRPEDSSSTDQAHSSATEQGPPSPGTSSRSTKVVADPALQSALDGKEAPPVVFAPPVESARSSKIPEHRGAANEGQSSVGAADTVAKADATDEVVGSETSGDAGTEVVDDSTESQEGAVKAEFNAEGTKMGAGAGDPSHGHSNSQNAVENSVVREKPAEKAEMEDEGSSSPSRS